jgi:hypothetical protein
MRRKSELGKLTSQAAVGLSLHALLHSLEGSSLSTEDEAAAFQHFRRRDFSRVGSLFCKVEMSRDGERWTREKRRKKERGGKERTLESEEFHFCNFN